MERHDHSRPQISALGGQFGRRDVTTTLGRGDASRALAAQLDRLVDLQRSGARGALRVLKQEGQLRLGRVPPCSTGPSAASSSRRAADSSAFDAIACVSAPWSVRGSVASAVLLALGAAAADGFCADAA